MQTNHSIGIDVGGTNTDIGLVDAEGRCLGRKNLPTNQYYDAAVYVADIYTKIEELMREYRVEAIKGIGIAAPMGIYYTGCIENAANLNFKGIVNLKELFSRHTAVPVVVSNDANAAAYGELVYGGAKGMKHIVMFTLGTGVGGGVVIDGKLVHGRNGGAGELGHIILIPGGRPCGCGRKGCLETYASATGIKNTALELLDQRPEYQGLLSKIDRKLLTSKDVGDAANAGDPLAMEVMELTGNWLGIALANAVAFSEPEAVFLMGGPVKAGKVFLDPIRESFEKHLCYVYEGKVQLKVSELPNNDAAILGAAALVELG